MTIKYNIDFDYWLRLNGITIIEQVNYFDTIAFHSWKSKESLFETPTFSTVAIWTVKTKVL